MKPVSVRFRCFGPYMQEQFVDFEALEKNGLFLICGETGAGKTTILDAICYALYGRSSGGLRGDLSVMRCKLAGKQDETLTEFVFDSNGKRYQFVRSLKYGRKNLNDTHNCLVWEDGRYVPIFENPKATNVNQKAQELIGLTYDQFRQVIVLPQGQFERLLVSDSAEKEKILVSLFHAERWQRIAEEVYRRVSERDTALQREKQQISDKLREYGCETIETLEQKIALQARALEQLTLESSAAEEKLTQCRRRNEQAILENRDFEELHRREKRLETLRERLAQSDEEEALLRHADAAEKIRPQFTAFQEARTRRDRAEKQTAQAEAALKAAGKALAAAEESQRLHEAARGEQEQRKRQVTLLENARELYHSLASKEREAQQARRALAAARSAMDEAERVYASRDRSWQQAITAQNQAMEDYRHAQAAYLQGIGSALAEKLIPGQPCPVCGSREHPAPAQSGAEHVTQAQLERKNQRMNGANDAVSAALRQRSEAESARNRAAAGYHQASQTEAIARGNYENALARRIPGIDKETQLEETIRTLREQAAEFDRADVLLQQTVNEARGREIGARGRLEEIRKELSAAAAAYSAQLAVWQGALAESGLETEEAFRRADLKPEEKQRRKTELLRFRADWSQARDSLQEQRDALEGREAPDMAAIQKALSAAQDAYKKLSAQQILAAKGLETARNDAKSLAKQEEKRSAQRLAVDADLDFANRLRGRSGVSLQRYVLGVMLTSVTVEANRLLASVCGGRYRLYRTDAISGSGHKGGLELEVSDSLTNARRSVTTLSGGEKFLVALSLAIGLSTVVQAQGGGVRLEAMFIDEGFGSLDREAVNDAMEVLQGIQRSAGIVGIISHVEQLAETIPTRLEITKGRHGSTCRLQNG